MSKTIYISYVPNNGNKLFNVLYILEKYYIKYLYLMCNK